MASTPPRFRLSCKSLKTDVNKDRENIGSSESTSKTPTIKSNLKSDQDNDYSPVYFPTTQESNEDIDVLWDWHSPQTSERRRRKQKRLIPVQSPNVPLKRHNSNNQNQNFEKLRDELKLLQEELAIPDDESCLCVSPQQEMEFKHHDHIDNTSQFEKEPESQFDNFDDIFNDSVDEQLVQFTQKIESDLLNQEKTKPVEKPNQDSVFDCDNNDIDELINKYSKSNNCDILEKEPNKEIFNKVLDIKHVESISKISNANKNCKISFQRTYSDDHGSRNVIHTISGKFELHRTKSFESEANGNSHVNLPRSKIEEIERKRLEALAKLALKKNQEIKNSKMQLPSQQLSTQKCSSGEKAVLEEIERKRLEALAKLTLKKNQENNRTQLSIQKCSPEEIERKRLQALARREAKRLEEIVEKNRQEALKKLQANRIKNANIAKSTITT